MQVSQSHYGDKENREPTLTEESANAVTNNLFQQQMLKKLQAMQKEIQELKSQQPGISSDYSKRKKPLTKKKNRHL